MNSNSSNAILRAQVTPLFLFAEHLLTSITTARYMLSHHSVKIFDKFMPCMHNLFSGRRLKNTRDEIVDVVVSEPPGSPEHGALQSLAPDADVGERYHSHAVDQGCLSKQPPSKEVLVKKLAHIYLFLQERLKISPLLRISEISVFEVGSPDGLPTCRRCTG